MYDQIAGIAINMCSKLELCFAIQKGIKDPHFDGVTDLLGYFTYRLTHGFCGGMANTRGGQLVRLKG